MKLFFTFLGCFVLLLTGIANVIIGITIAELLLGLFVGLSAFGVAMHSHILSVKFPKLRKV